MKNRSYDREFKLNAVKLYIESGKALGIIANDLGIPKSTLNTWVKEYKGSG